jgi:light-regulated signal transduction histidine kinase (bacteriophytochrome)
MKALFSTLIEHSLTYNLAPRPRMGLCCEEREHERQFAVKTNNGGLSGKELSHIFAAPQLLSPQEFEGTNVGLSSCKRILERLCSKIWVENGPAKGVSYHVTIPTTRVLGEV